MDVIGLLFDYIFRDPSIPESTRRLFGQLQIPIVKAALLDQRVVAGIGNIYASEALFRAGISPKRLAKSVQGERATKLARMVRVVLNEAIAAGGSSLRDYVQTDGELGYFQKRWRVYEREGLRCRGCTCDPAITGGIKRIVQSGRASFYCPRKQK